MRNKIIAVDFDGTLVEDKWPEIGATNNDVLTYCKVEQAGGARIILWTNRVEPYLGNAVKWCEENGLRLDAVNDNIQETIDHWGHNPRKVYADEFIDDRMVRGFRLPYVAEFTTIELAPKTLQIGEEISDIFNRKLCEAAEEYEKRLDYLVKRYNVEGCSIGEKKDIARQIAELDRAFRNLEKRHEGNMAMVLHNVECNIKEYEDFFEAKLNNEPREWG